jgi:hypothetical protein
MLKVPGGTKSISIWLALSRTRHAYPVARIAARYASFVTTAGSGTSSIKVAQLGTMQGAILGILALLLGLSFSGATTRFVERQDVLVREANSIGTAYLRADLLGSPWRESIKNHLRDYTAARIELFDSVRREEAMMINARLQEHFGETDIIDLKIPFYALSTNLTSGHVHIHRSGSLRQALRATISLPGILPPVVEGDDILVDGGVLDNRDQHGRAASAAGARAGRHEFRVLGSRRRGRRRPGLPPVHRGQVAGRAGRRGARSVRGGLVQMSGRQSAGWCTGARA